MDNLNSEPLVSVGGGGSDEPVTIEFTDGPHTLPAYMVRLLGGRDLVLREKEALGQFTYLTCMEAFNRQMAAEKLNRIQADFVRGHLKRLRDAAVRQARPRHI